MGQGHRGRSRAQKGWEGWQAPPRLPVCPLATSTETQQSPEHRFLASWDYPAQTDLGPGPASLKVPGKRPWRLLYQSEPQGGDLLQERGGGVSWGSEDAGPAPAQRGCRVWEGRGDSCSSL